MRIKPAYFVSLALLVALSLQAAARAGGIKLRPPAVPLVTHDPYFSVWSPADRLTDATTTHWTGKPHPLRSLLRVDGRAYRLMGSEPAAAAALAQVDVQVLPTRTIYRFADAKVAVTLTFLTPALPSDLDALARPATYLTWEVRSADGRPHAAELYFDCGAELAVSTPKQEVVSDQPTVAGLEVLKLGSKEQPVLAKKGDDLRIDWGYLYLAVSKDAKVRTAATSGAEARMSFVESGSIGTDSEAIRKSKNLSPSLSGRGEMALIRPPSATLHDRSPSPPAPLRAPTEGWSGEGSAGQVLAASFDLGQVGAEPVSRQVILAYDDLYSINYFGSRLRPYWRRGGAEAADMLRAAAGDYAALSARCRKFDEELMADLRRVGGEKYALLCALAYRQAWAGNKLAADADGRPLVFPKENFSNGCISTVDVLFPQAPFFLALSPALAKGMLVPILDYASSPRWPYDYAPHDLGTYPFATGQVYGMGGGDGGRMPVEESGNMLIMLAALARIEGNAELAKQYWPLLSRWAGYLAANGLDPENQLCSADMFGHLPHCANLALKAVIALGGYAQLCERVGKPDDARAYMAIARRYAAKWQELAKGDGRTRLAYHLPGTWGMKHNLIWDRVLGLNLFPDAVGDAEVAWYRKVQNKYGLPVDGRTSNEPHRLGRVERCPGAGREGLRGPRRAPVPLRRRDPLAGAALGLVRDHRRTAAGVPGPARRGRHFRQTARRRAGVQEMGRPGDPGLRPVGALADHSDQGPAVHRRAEGTAEVVRGPAPRPLDLPRTGRHVLPHGHEPAVLELQQRKRHPPLEIGGPRDLGVAGHRVAVWRESLARQVPPGEKAALGAGGPLL